MKKLLFKMIIVLLVIITGFCGYYGYLGYQIYQDKIQEQSLSERVHQLKSKEDYVTLDQISPIYKEAVLESEDRRFLSTWSCRLLWFSTCDVDKPYNLFF